MSSDYWQTIVNKQNRIIRKLESVFSYARITKPNQTKLLANIEEIRVTNDYKKSPIHVKSYFEGYYNCLYNQFNHNELRSGYDWKGIIYYTPHSWDAMPEECRQAIRENKGPECKIYYKDTNIIYFDDSMLSEESKKRIASYKKG
jgi:hypothetical protein